ncbi:Frataxin, partial [Atractiella rhizophila]
MLTFSRVARHLRYDGFQRNTALLSMTRTKFQSRSFKSFQAAWYEKANLSEREYHDISDGTMDSLTESLEKLVEQQGDDWEVEYSSGVLTLKLGSQGTYVINKQPPNKEIWLSSPVSGPKRYSYDAKEQTWFYPRDESTMKGLLEKELTDVVGETEVKLDC